jgi:hypothetical protein
MITEDKMAAAQLAKIFGSELMRVDEFTTQQASMSGPAVRLDPKQVLLGNSPQRPMAEQERRIMEAVQREAEMSYPTEPSQQYQEPQPPPLPIPAAQQPPPLPVQVAPQVGSIQFAPQIVPQQTDVWSSIAYSLERIANRLEEVDISFARRKVRRKK